MHRRRHARRACLQRLRATDLAAVGGDGSVVGHVLRLEGANLETAIFEVAGETSDDQRLADVGPGTLKHDCFCRHQNSMPSWAFTPAEK